MGRKTGYPSKDKVHLKGKSFLQRHPLIIPLNMFFAFKLFNSFHMNETAIEYDGEKITKKQVKNDTLKAIKSLKSLGLKSGQKIVIVSPNTYEGVVLNLAASSIGVATVFLNHTDTTENIAIDIISHNASVLFIFGNNEEYARKIQSTAKSIEYIIYIETKDEKSKKIDLKQTSDYFSYRTFIARSDDYRKSTFFTRLKYLFNNSEIVYLQTSGSTGKSKTMPFTNKNVFASLMYCSNSTDIKVRDKVFKRCLCVMPYRLPYGWGMIFLNLIGGQVVIIPTGSSPKEIGEYYKLKPNVIYGTPTLLRGMIDNTPLDADLSSLKVFFSGGFLLPLRWHEESMEFFWRHGVHPQICNDYGIGESLCVGTTSKDTTYYHSTVGRFFVGPEWLIVDEDLKEVKYDEPGEILISSKSLCKYYYGNIKATKDAFVKIKGKTFYRTNDFASIDRQGIISFIGRKKRFYLPLGAPEKVYCASIENIIMNSGLVKSCAVVPREDKEKAMIGYAFVTLKNKDDQDAVVKELREYLKTRLLEYQMPKEITPLDKLPVLSSGKPDYVSLQNLNL